MLASRLRGAATAVFVALALAAAAARAATPMVPDSTLIDGDIVLGVKQSPYCGGAGDRFDDAHVVIEESCAYKIDWYGTRVELPDSAHIVISLHATPLGSWRPWDCWYTWQPFAMGPFPTGHHVVSVELRIAVPPDSVSVGGVIALHRQVAFDVAQDCVETWSLRPRVNHTVVGQPPCPSCPPVLCPGRPIPIRVDREMTGCWQYEGLSLEPTAPGEPPNIIAHFRDRSGYCIPEGTQALDTISLPGLAPGTHSLDVIEVRKNERDSTVLVMPGLRRTFTVRDFYASACDSLPPIDWAGPYTRFELRAGPNPSQGAIRFAVQLPEAADVELSLYDLGGRRVARLLRDRCAAGEREVRWDAAGARSGIYFARLSVNGQVRTTRVVLRLGR